jgi:hypothetical protein
MRQLLLCLCIVGLSGCATFSFAPPVVDQRDVLEQREHQTMFTGICTPTPVDGQTIQPNVAGALALIGNYELTYRCQRDRAANGRQGFELPAFLGTAGAATAAALGAPAAVAIVAGAGSATLDHTKQYYAPQDKAKALSAGLAAILCIDARAVGVGPYTLQTLSNAQTANPSTVQPALGTNALEAVGATLGPPGTTGANAEISYGRQYFELIRNALFSVEQVVAQRLSAAGTPFDAKGVMAEIAALNKKQTEEAETPTAKNPEATGEKTQRALKTAQQDNPSAAVSQLAAISPEKVGMTIIKLDQLQTNLDQCIVEAKI